MKKIIVPAITLSGTCYSQDRQLDDYILECQEYFSSNIGTNKESLEAICTRDGEANLLWYSSGKPTVYVHKNGCSFMALKGSSAEECLPEKLPGNIKAIQILTDSDAKTKLLTDVADRVKSGGAQTVIIKTN